MGKEGETEKNKNKNLAIKWKDGTASGFGGIEAEGLLHKYKV